MTVDRLRFGLDSIGVSEVVGNVLVAGSDRIDTPGDTQTNGSGGVEAGCDLAVAIAWR
jgi:hypothetical protein